MGATSLADQAQFDPMDVLDALAAQLRRHGGTVHEGRRVVGVSRRGMPEITLDDGRVLRADNVVLATGVPTLDRGLYFSKVEAKRSYLLAYGREHGGVPGPEVFRRSLDARGCFTPSLLDAPMRLDDGGSASPEATIGDMLPGIDGGLAGCETRLALEQAIHALCPRDQLVVRLRYLEDRSQAEVGEAIGVTQTQVSRILTRIIDDLRTQLEGVGIAA